MSLQYSEENEVYMRISRRMFDLISEKKIQFQHGRTMPLILRSHESIIWPDSILRAKQYIELITGLIFLSPVNDYAISSVVDIALEKAQQNNWQGEWEKFYDLFEYFQMEIESEDPSFKPSRVLPPLEFLTRDQRNNFKPEEREGLPFSPYYWTEFLQRHFSEDDIFGNLIVNAIYKVRGIKIVNMFDISFTKDNRPVKYPGFIGRGYKDHGTMSTVEASARKQANIRTEKIKHRTSSLPMVIDWGLDEPPD